MTVDQLIENATPEQAETLRNLPRSEEEARQAGSSLWVNPEDNMIYRIVE